MKHAFASINNWGGKITATSEIGIGTTISISLPIENPPAWFADKIQLKQNHTVVVFDDDPSIHQIWSQRFDEHLTINLIHFFSKHALEEWVKKYDGHLKKTFFLVDFEIINEKESGLDIIELLKISKQSILVTSCYEEIDIIRQCQSLNVKLLPKSMAALIPISIIEEQCYDLILIDDDKLIHQAWELLASSLGKKIKSFTDPSDFISSYMIFSTDIPVYIDSNLGNSIRGEIIAKDIYMMGFKEIYLTTGTDAHEFSSLPYLKGVIGKTPSWT